MFFLAVFITILLVGMIWFRSFQKNIFVLMNPEDDAEKALAAQNINMPSLFGYVGKSVASIKGLISGLMGNDGELPDMQGIKTENGGVYMLPLSDYK